MRPAGINAAPTNRGTAAKPNRDTNRFTPSIQYAVQRNLPVRIPVHG